MVDVSIRVLDDDEWQLYREVRLAALRDAPKAFVARFEDEASYGDDFWREQMNLAYRLVAERKGKAVGVVSLGLRDGDPEDCEVRGLWTEPVSRGQRVAWSLVSAASQKAAQTDCRLLYYWVRSNNASAVSFASSFGFRPADRRPVRVADGAPEKSSDEVAMVLPLSSDPTPTLNPYLP